MWTKKINKKIKIGVNCGGDARSAGARKAMETFPAWVILNIQREIVN